MFRLLGNLMSPAGERARLAILIFHRVLPAPDPLLDEIDAAGFERHMSFLKRAFNVLPLGEACERLARNSLPPRAACVTFDDGYANNEEIALPVLKRLGMPAAFFVSTGFLDGSTMFNDGIIEVVRTSASGEHDLRDLGLPVLKLDSEASRRAAIDVLIAQVKYRPSDERLPLVERMASRMRGTLPKNLMMRPEQVKRLHHAGMEIGSHTVSHPILRGLDDESARRELVDSKHQLEAITGARITLFAYPNGKPGTDYGPEHVRMVRDAGYAAALATTSGLAGRGSDLFQLPRINPWERNPRRLGLRLLLECSRPVAFARL